MTRRVEDIDATRVLLDPPYLIQVKAKEPANCNLVNNLMTSQDYRLALVTGGHVAQQAQEASPDIDQALATGKADLAGAGAPQCKSLGIGCSCLLARKPLEMAIVNVEQASMGLHGQSQPAGQRFDGLAGAEERTGVQGRNRFSLQSLRNGAGLGLASAVQGNVGVSPEPFFAGARVPGGLAVADEDDPDHFISLSWDRAIVARRGTGVKVGKPKGRKDWENWIDQQIREAQERGAFDDLPGKGKPLDLTPNPYAPDQELAFKVLKDAGYAPEWIELDKAIRGKLERARTTLVRSREWYEGRLAELAGHSGGWADAERDRALASWRQAIVCFQLEVTDTNEEIADLNLKVPSPRFQRSMIDAIRELERLEGSPR
jgi:DnaJ family protein C protein 28